MLKLCIAIALPLVLISACGGPLKYNLPATSKAPGADARLVAELIKDQNMTKIEFTATNLPPPDRLATGATQFVAWHRPSADRAWNRTGTLKYEAGPRKGELSGSVPETQFDFEVTAEPAGEPASPSSEVIFAQHVAK